MSYYPADFRVFGNVTPWPNRGRISAADSSPSSRRGENPSKVRVAHDSPEFERLSWFLVQCALWPVVAKRETSDLDDSEAAKQPKSSSALRIEPSITVGQII